MLSLLVLTFTRADAQCQAHEGVDTIEKYYNKSHVDTGAACCDMCSSDKQCSFATFFEKTCYLKNAKTTTPKRKAGCTLFVVRAQPTLPPSPGPRPSPLPPPPLPAPKYKVELVEHNAEPVLSSANEVGKGYSPCAMTFNPSYVDIAGQNKLGGIIVRTDGCKNTSGRLSFAPCDLETGVCGDLDASYQAPASQGTEDPRVIYDQYSGYFYNFAYGVAKGQSAADKCGGAGVPGGEGACTVILSRTKTPANASSWEHVPGGTYPWHRNGCCHMRPVGQRTYCIFGESGSEGPGSGLGIAYTTDISTGRFTQTNWTAGVPGDGNGHGLWMKALGAAQEEIKLEAGAHMVQLEGGDLLHFYAAATPGWVANGNYTAGYIVLDKDEPTRIIQRGSGQWMVPTYAYETLCNGSKPCKYQGERRNVIFLCSATRIGPNRFRLFFGGGDGNVGTGVVQVTQITPLPAAAAAAAAAALPDVEAESEPAT